jgi:hypothetical protein
MMMDEFTFQYNDDGLLLNDDFGGTTSLDPSGVASFTPFFDIVRVEGLASSDFRTTERSREGMDGGDIDAEFEEMRTITIEGTVYSPPELLESYLDSLKDNYAPTKIPLPLYWRAPGINDRVVFCKSYGAKYTWDDKRRLGIADVQIQLKAEDPSIYDADVVSGNTGLPSAGTGRAYPRAYSYGYGSPAAYDDIYVDTYSLITHTSGLGGRIDIVNGGNKPTGAVITIYGPIISPTVAHDLTGRQLMFNISLASNEYLEINLRARTVKLNGTANRRNAMSSTSRWFMLAPGINSLRLLGTDPIGGAPDPAMVVEARGAYR